MSTTTANPPASAAATKGTRDEFCVFTGTSCEELSNHVALILQKPLSKCEVSTYADSEISVEDTSTLLYTYIDAVDTDLDKDKIKSQMSDLMIEAQTLEIA